MRNSADPVTLTVIQSGIRAAAREMFETLRKTAMSPIIYEVLDVGTGVTDAAGNLADSGAGIPTFVGVIDKAVRRIIELTGSESIVEGDLFVTNDPNFGGVTHLNDVVLAMPVFHAGERIAWAASIGHWSDVGGMTPGSMSTDAVDIHQEGLRLPAVRFRRRQQQVDGGQAGQASREPCVCQRPDVAGRRRDPDRDRQWRQLGGAGLIGVAGRARGFVHLITAVLVANRCRSHYTRVP